MINSSLFYALDSGPDETSFPIVMTVSWNHEINKHINIKFLLSGYIITTLGKETETKVFD